MVQITDTARDRIKEILEKESGKSLRIYIQGMG
jgi:Fe-S cluster assembly iron-binding protein IscA